MLYCDDGTGKFYRWSSHNPHFNVATHQRRWETSFNFFLAHVRDIYYVPNKFLWALPCSQNLRCQRLCQGPLGVFHEVPCILPSKKEECREFLVTFVAQPGSEVKCFRPLSIDQRACASLREVQKMKFSCVPMKRKCFWFWASSQSLPQQLQKQLCKILPDTSFLPGGSLTWFI